MRAADHRPTWLCPEPGDRARMLDMERRLTPVRGVTFAMLALTLVSAGPQIGWWPLLVLALAVAGFVVLGHGLEKCARPEYRLAVAWCLAQSLIAMSIALTGGPDSPALAWLVIPAVTLPARFGRSGVIAGTVFTIGALLAVTVGIDPAAVAADTAHTVSTLALVVCVLVLSTALMRSDLDHRAEAIIDPLTGMLNRTALGSRVAELEQQARLAGQPVAMLIVDVDRFKQLNDDHGHAVGDAVLVEVATRIRGELRAYDAAYRIGGDEFLVLLPGAGEHSAAELGRALCTAVSLDACAGIEVTVSIGVSGSAGGVFNYEDVFIAADNALYVAKAAGRGRVSAVGGAVSGDGAVIAA